MTSSRFEICGAVNIQQHISVMLRQAEEQLTATCKPFAAELLFTVQQGANYICLDLVKPQQDGLGAVGDGLNVKIWKRNRGQES